MAKSGTRSKSTSPAEQPAAPRNADGTFAAGGASANPGGLSREYREFRRWCQEKGGRVREILGAWLESDDRREREFALNVILIRGWGLPVKASELPDTEESPVPTPEECSTSALLAQTRALLAQGVGALSRKTMAGELGAEDMAALGRVGHSLGELMKAEKEAEKEAEARSGLAEKSTEELLALIPREVLVAHLATRTDAPESRKPAAPDGEGVE